MAQQHGNGRNAAGSDENRERWRQHDDRGRRLERHENERDYMFRDRDRDDDRFMHRGHWDDSYERRFDRDDDRYEDERMRYLARYPETFDERDIEERFVGRGGREYGYNPERFGAQGGYAGGRGFEYGGGYGHEDERIGPLSRSRRHEDEGRYGYRTQGRGHRGKGPVNYVRSDERVREQICELLTDDDRIDASAIEVTVRNGEVTLAGIVEDRWMKRLVEDVVEDVFGVKDVQNQIRVGDKRTASGKENDSATQDKRHRA